MFPETAPADHAPEPPDASEPVQGGRPALAVVAGPRLDLPAPDVQGAVAAAGLLADRTRAGILRLLRDGPHCVCEMASALEERQNNVSMHLARLRQAGLVRQVEHAGDARWVFYERDDAACSAAESALREVLG